MRMVMMTNDDICSTISNGEAGGLRHVAGIHRTLCLACRLIRLAVRRAGIVDLEMSRDLDEHGARRNRGG